MPKPVSSDAHLHDPEHSTDALLDHANLLDNPIWNALLTEQNSIALSNGCARRFPPEIGPLAGIADQSASSYDALCTLAGPDGIVVLFCVDSPPTPPGWSSVRGGLIVQMICRKHTPGPSHPSGVEFRRLTPSDVPAMVELATLAEPGPFQPRTIELGAFFGVFDTDRLVAMAGQRLRLPGFIEVSAVCTHPEARGRGYARLLMARVIEDIRQQSRTPILHALASNESALRVYRDLGFTLRRNLHLAVLKNDEAKNPDS